ncbi:MAG: ribokinase [Pseudomonadales bacterium]|nr:ribokinase [Pseudomonadales bacterium]
MNDNTSQIIVIGSINTDMIVKTNKLPSPGETVLGGEFLMNGGGKGANQAVAAARLGGRVAMVGCVGDDVFGSEAIQRLQQEGIDCHGVNREMSRTSGIALINVDASGENQIVVAAGANTAVSKTQVESAMASATEETLLLLQLEIPLEIVAHAIALAGQKACRVILDPAPANSLSSELLQSIYLLTPNQSEARVLTGEDVIDRESAERAAAALLAQGVSNVALTLGKDGLLLASDAGAELIPAQAVTAVDTTAAGDCFCGAVAVALAEGKVLSEAVRFANQAAAISVTRMGAQSALPYADEIRSQ